MNRAGQQNHECKAHAAHTFCCYNANQRQIMFFGCSMQQQRSANINTETSIVTGAHNDMLHSALLRVRWVVGTTFKMFHLQRISARGKPYSRTTCVWNLLAHPFATEQQKASTLDWCCHSRWRAFFQNVWLKNASFDRNLKIAPSIIIALKRSFTLAACGKWLRRYSHELYKTLLIKDWRH